MTGDDAEQQIVDLQARIAYQEDTLRELDSVVAAQSQRLARLEARLTRLAERLDSLPGPGDEASQDEPPPPHY